jgi:hypothetical protein
MDRDRKLPVVAMVAAIALPAVAAVLSLTHLLPHLAVLLCVAGVCFAGRIASQTTTAVTLAVLAGSLFVASFGIPASWDSYRMFARVGTVAALFGVVLAISPTELRKGLATAFFLFHFGGILTATTWPTPTPWITDQLANRLYQPYLKFLYLGNAYHFYSPEPGPASHIYFLVKSEKPGQIDPVSGKPAEVLEWVTLPTRPEQVRDPLALTYQRRLAISENVAQTTLDVFSPTAEKNEIHYRRAQVASGLWPNYPRIPYAPPEVEPLQFQYRIPSQSITSYILPSYVRHVAEHNRTAEQVPVKIRVYRLEHRIIRQQYLLNNGPFEPATYRCYFLGDYTPDGRLIDPQDPMLFWLVPIIPKPNAGDGESKYDDYFEKHANAKVEWRRP